MGDQPTMRGPTPEVVAQALRIKERLLKEVDEIRDRGIQYRKEVLEQNPEWNEGELKHVSSSEMQRFLQLIQWVKEDISEAYEAVEFIELGEGNFRGIEMILSHPWTPEMIKPYLAASAGYATWPETDTVEISIERSSN